MNNIYTIIDMNNTDYIENDTRDSPTIDIAKRILMKNKTLYHTDIEYHNSVLPYLHYLDYEMIVLDVNNMLTDISEINFNRLRGLKSYMHNHLYILTEHTNIPLYIQRAFNIIYTVINGSYNNYIKLYKKLQSPDVEYILYDIKSYEKEYEIKNALRIGFSKHSLFTYGDDDIFKLQYSKYQILDISGKLHHI